jgi:hypothetical protein
VSYIEIYNETLRDLLSFKKGPLRDDEKPTIHFNKVIHIPQALLMKQGKVWVEPLVEEIVSSPQDVVDLLEKGNAGRKVGATDWVSFAALGKPDCFRMSGLPARTVSSPLSLSRGRGMVMVTWTSVSPSWCVFSKPIVISADPGRI